MNEYTVKISKLIPYSIILTVCAEDENQAINIATGKAIEYELENWEQGSSFAEEVLSVEEEYEEIN